MKKIAFTGGGSAGHVLPNVALIEEILSDGKEDVCYIGSSGIEKDLVAKWNIPYFEVECPKLARGFSWANIKRNLKIPVQFFRAVERAKQGLRTFQPDLVFSKGGYVALPVVYAAKALKIPCFIHESDLSLGLANRLSLPVCKTLFTSFPETAKRYKKGVHSGAPIRQNIFHASKAHARIQLSLPYHQKTLLVFGGGSGSKRINEAVRTHIQALTKNYVVLHVCGKGNTMQSNVENYRQFEFVADMGTMYAAADVVVARAGAGTLFELLALQKPALFIPLEAQSRGDQVQNANYFLRKGLCHVLRENDLSALPKAIDETFMDEQLRTQLRLSSFTSANARILRAIRQTLHQKDEKNI